MDRLGTKADVVADESVVGHLLGIADSVKDDDRPVLVLLKGEYLQDDRGLYFSVTGVADGPEDAVGVMHASPDEGLEPDADVVGGFSGRFPDWILMSVDPYACSFAVFRVTRGEVRRADLLVRE